MNPLTVCGGILIGGAALMGAMIVVRSLARRQHPAAYHPRPRFSVYQPAHVPVPIVLPYPPSAHGHFMERIHGRIPPFSFN